MGCGCKKQTRVVVPPKVETTTQKTNNVKPTVTVKKL